METAPITNSSVLDRIFKYLKFENATSLIAIFSGLSILISVAIEFGYFSVFDKRLIFFFSLQDVISNALIIIPILIPSFVITILMFADVARPTSPDSSEKSKDEVSPKRRIIKVIIIALLVPICLVFSYFAGLIFTPLFTTFLLGSSLLFAHKSGGEDSIGRRRVASIFLVLSVVFLWMGLGELAGHIDLRSDQNDYEIRMGEDSFRALIVMANPDFVVVRDTQRQVRFIPRSKIDEIRFLSVHK